jgi:hypothetical protein
VYRVVHGRGTWSWAQRSLPTPYRTVGAYCTHTVFTTRPLLVTCVDRTSSSPLETELTSSSEEEPDDHSAGSLSSSDSESSLTVARRPVARGLGSGLESPITSRSLMSSSSSPARNKAVPRIAARFLALLKSVARATDATDKQLSSPAPHSAEASGGSGSPGPTSAPAAAVGR